MSNKHLPSTSIVDEDDDDEENLDSPPVKTRPSKKQKCACEEGLFHLLVLNSHLPQYLADDECNKDGMHHDVHVMEIKNDESDSQATKHPRRVS